MFMQEIFTEQVCQISVPSYHQVVSQDCEEIDQMMGSAFIEPRHSTRTILNWHPFLCITNMVFLTT